MAVENFRSIKVQNMMTERQDNRSMTISLPEIRVAIVTTIEMIIALNETALVLFGKLPALNARIERNRQRSDRNNHRGRDDAHEHHDDTRTVLTKTGLATECMKCGRVIAVDATSRLMTFGGEGA